VEGPVLVASEELLALLDGLELVARAPTADDRAFFERRYASAAAHFDDDYFWWVREHFVELAAVVGTPRLIGSLLQRASQPGEDSVERTRVAALAALAVLSGRDLRRDAHGQPRAEADVARDYLAACAPPASR
jgi:hypothetical protein